MSITVWQHIDYFLSILVYFFAARITVNQLANRSKEWPLGLQTEKKTLEFDFSTSNNSYRKNTTHDLTRSLVFLELRRLRGWEQACFWLFPIMSVHNIEYDLQWTRRLLTSCSFTSQNMSFAVRVCVCVCVEIGSLETRIIPVAQIIGDAEWSRQALLFARTLDTTASFCEYWFCLHYCGAAYIGYEIRHCSQRIHEHHLAWLNTGTMKPVTNVVSSLGWFQSLGECDWSIRAFTISCFLSQSTANLQQLP